MFENQMSYILTVLKNETFQIVSFLLFVSFITIYVMVFYKPIKKRYKRHEVNIYYKGDKVASKDIEL